MYLSKKKKKGRRKERGHWRGGRNVQEKEKSLGGWKAKIKKGVKVHGGQIREKKKHSNSAHNLLHAKRVEF